MEEIKILLEIAKGTLIAIEHSKAGGGATAQDVINTLEQIEELLKPSMKIPRVPKEQRVTIIHN